MQNKLLILIQGRKLKPQATANTYTYEIKLLLLLSLRVLTSVSQESSKELTFSVKLISLGLKPSQVLDFFCHNHL